MGILLKSIIYKAFKKLGLPMTWTISHYWPTKPICISFKTSKIDENPSSNSMFHFHETITPRRHIWPPSLIEMEGKEEFKVK